jgi:hypothetical protein
MPWWRMSAPWRSSTSPLGRDFGEASIGSAACRCPEMPLLAVFTRRAGDFGSQRPSSLSNRDTAPPVTALGLMTSTSNGGVPPH